MRAMSGRLVLRNLAVAAALAVVGSTLVAGVAAAATGPARVLQPAAPVPGATQRPVDRSQVPTSLGAPAGLTLQSTSGGPVTEGEGGGYGCNTFINHSFSDVGQDGFLDETIGMAYYAGVDCNFTLDNIDSLAGILDRSPSFNGESFDGDQIDAGTYSNEDWVDSATSIGSVAFDSHYYNGARRVEFAYELFLLAPKGFIWGACNPVPGLRYLVCEGLDTDYLHVVLGTGGLDSGLTKACRDLSRPVGDAERARLFAPSGSTTPNSTTLISSIGEIKAAVIQFKKLLCAVTSASAGVSFANERGLQLWTTAVARAKAEIGQGDDRPLYWARLSMAVALWQWLPTFAVDQGALQNALERSSRGMTSSDFTAGSGPKAFISGFDPFQLDADLNSGNPSGVAVLRLDGATVNGAQVQAVIFPVRYDDFDAGLVESVFTPHLAPGSQQATIVTTVSQHGPANFQLEFYNGNKRASPAGTTVASTDNRNRFPDPLCHTCGTYENPIPSGAPGPQFTQTTLPVDLMKAACGCAVTISTAVDEKVAPSNPTTHRTDGPTLGSVSVAGSGGGFLSNEIAYRVTALRDRLGVTVPAGHVHTPGDHSQRWTTAMNYESMLSAAIGGPYVPPIRVTVSSPQYQVKQKPSYTVNGAPNSPVKWTTIRDGVVVETDVRHGANTNAAGAWSGSYHRLVNRDVGTWVQWVRVNGRLASTQFTVTGSASAVPPVHADFDADERTDISVWRPSDGTWYVINSASGSTSASAFGQNGDRPVDGDFDGDGRTDIAVFRPGNATWYLQQSSDGYQEVAFGQPGDVPVPADYDGDGLTDLAVWRVGSTQWIIRSSIDASVQVVPIGTPADLAAVGDFDGDGRADPAVFRRMSATWYVYRSTLGQTVLSHFGTVGDRPVPGDYDGDHLTDLATFRPGDGTWWIRESSTGNNRVVTWGLSTDLAVPADYDGDGLTDIAIYRPSDGSWWIINSTGSTVTYNWGLSADLPIPNVNNR